jgi:hypothetical protein
LSSPFVAAMRSPPHRSSRLTATYLALAEAQANLK